MFGALIAVHEFGHFAAAKKLGVKVNEFAIGMGPKLWSRQRGETLYALRLLPIGGACVMEGEDSENEGEPDPRAFTSQARWKRAIILAAGAFMNLVMGAVIVVILCLTVKTGGGIVDLTVQSLAPGFPDNGAAGLMVGDKIISIDGNRVFYSDDFGMIMNFSNAPAGLPIDMVVERNGERILLDNYDFTPREYTEDGYTRVRYGITLTSVEETFGAKMKFAAFKMYYNVRAVQISLVELFSGRVGVQDMSGVVGIVTVVNDIGTAPMFRSLGERLWVVFDIFGLIAVNLAIMNLLPLPALDGGRILGLVVTFVIEKITRRHLNPCYEGYVHAVGLVLLMVLMIVITVSDVIKIF